MNYAETAPPLENFRRHQGFRQACIAIAGFVTLVSVTVILCSAVSTITCSSFGTKEEQVMVETALQRITVTETRVTNPAMAMQVVLTEALMPTEILQAAEAVSA